VSGRTGVAPADSIMSRQGTFLLLFSGKYDIEKTIFTVDVKKFGSLSMPVKVIIADDHAVVRAGIRAIVEGADEEIQVIGEASDGKELLDLVSRRPADVYLLDIEMPVMSGIETIERLLRARPGSKALVLSMYKDKVLVERVFMSGAMGYVLKESLSEDLVRGIVEVSQGNYYLSPKISGYLVDIVLSKEAGVKEEKKGGLTVRQREILKLICDGLSEKEIAGRLDISSHTVHVHKNNIMNILDIHTKAGLIRYALREGIIQL
jgi:DNA-binding NarL/FixJ family response regulator